MVVNADDFGFTRGVNAGIVEAHRGGILTATTLMANGAAFDDAVRLARETPTLDVGVHLVLVSGRSLVRPECELPATVAGLLKAILGRRIRIYDELRAQVEKIAAAGIVPTHLDTHKHTHLLPPVLEAVARLGQEFGIPWVRRPFDFPLSAPGAVPWGKRAVNRGLRLVRRRFHRVLAAGGLRTTDHFAGFRITGRFRTRELVALIGHLPSGVTELMTHPGRCDEELRRARTRLKESREEELRALTAPETWRAIEMHGVRLVRYRDLAPAY
ncbi:MAG: ChbG/HpnK family deacetylase [Acidobacteria bacterium]|nr:ChbG/HpnK family deacetylase [Acidobacteriota bacterium]